MTMFVSSRLAMRIEQCAEVRKRIGIGRIAHMKPIRFSQHARRQMFLRGATEVEVAETIQKGNWKPARRAKLQVYKTFPFEKSSPVINVFMASKLPR